MEEKIMLRIGSRKLHLVKLIGAFVVLGSALMLLSDIYQLMSIASVMGGPAGQSVTLNFYGLTMQETLGNLDAGAKAGLVLLPLARVMFWAAVVALGTVIYKSGGITLPIREKLKKISEEEKPSKEESEEVSPGRERYKKVKGKYACPECGKEFDSERGLHIHQGKEHS